MAERNIKILIPDPQFRQHDPYFTEKKAEKVNKNLNKKFAVFKGMNRFTSRTQKKINIQ